MASALDQVSSKTFWSLTQFLDPFRPALALSQLSAKRYRRLQICQLLWSPEVTESDKLRWYSEGFHFYSEPSLGCFLAQREGGPCGVLAAAQAEIVRQILVEREHGRTLSPESFAIPREDQSLYLARALTSIFLYIGEGQQVTLLLPLEAKTWQEKLTRGDFSLDDTQVVTLRTRSEGRTGEDPSKKREEIVELVSRTLRQLSSGSVFWFLVSALLTRGLENIRQDMDDESHLIGKFGHCSQELVNLLLTGKAVSNVFDGNVPLGETGLVLKGISSRPLVGYLTQLEALRYCQVGIYLKNPEYPIWVIASTSHFSVLIGSDPRVNELNKEEALLARFQQAFKAIDTQESGFIECGKLADVVHTADPSNSHGLGSTSALQRLVSAVDTTDAGIILWDDLWKVISVEILGEREEGERERKRLRDRSDSDIARELQAQFDAEAGGAGATAASASPSLPLSMPKREREEEERKREQPTKYTMYYFNALLSHRARHPVIPFDLTLKRREIVGKSVPLSSLSSGGHGTAIEEVIRTRWPECTFDWRGAPPPSID